MSDLRRRVHDQIEDITGKYWRHDGNSTFRSYVSSVFQPVSSLWRSASSLTLNNEFMEKRDRGSLRRSSSYTSLSPSMGMPLRDRSVSRVVSSYRVYPAKSDDWRRESYSFQRSASFIKGLEEKSYRRKETPIYTPPTTYRSPYAYDSGTRYSRLLTRPANMPRHHYLFVDNSARIKASSSPLLGYRNYDLDDDRRMYRCYNYVRSVPAPKELRRFYGKYYYSSPRNNLVVY